MTIWNVISLMGGLAMFIFGMNMMSDGLKLVAGGYLKNILEKLTKNKFIAMLVGAGLTALIQSSNAMCVMVVGFVNAGIMQLEKSVGILMGAKIGTTITGQLIAFDIASVAPVIAFIGVAVNMFSKKTRPKTIGQIIASLGVLFIGLGQMSSSMKPLGQEEWFQNILEHISNPFMGVIIGVIITAIIQSASASVGILQMMAMAGAIGFRQAFYIMMGMNIGASIAPALASIGGRKDAKRVALIVALFETVGMLLFLIVTLAAPGVLGLIQGTSHSPARQIANANSIFNIVTVIVLLPCSDYLVKLSRWVIKGEDKEQEESLHFIDKSGHQSGTVLLEQIDQEIARMHDLVKVNMEESTRIYQEGKMSITDEEFEKNEATIDFLNKEITDALVRTGELGVTEEESFHAAGLYHIVTDLERIGDHAENILGYYKSLKKAKKKFSGKALRDLNDLCSTVYKILDLDMEYLKHSDRETYYTIYETEERIDNMVEKMRNNNIKRLSKSKCEATPGLLFAEILVDLERVGDHCLNIAKACKRYDIPESLKEQMAVAGK